jgi:UDP-N-acetylmuramoylalanine--D-glutamate ligase
LNTYTDKLYVVAGLGKTGLSCVRFLRAQGARVRATDTRSEPPMLGELRTRFPEVEFVSGLSEAVLEDAVAVVTSPGLDLRLPFFTAARMRGLPVFGDVELFARHAKARKDVQVVAITGSNGKSTVTTLLAEMAQQTGRRVAVGGNLGTPALDLLADDIDLYVLELSSFQLELTDSLDATAATVLNVTPDHIDRHGTLEHYAALKARIFRGTGVCVLNRDDPVVAAMAPAGRKASGFTLHAPRDEHEYGLITDEEGTWLARGLVRLLNLSELRVKGLHNATNALAALALGTAISLPLEAMQATLRKFPGLPHRCQWVASIRGVNWYNDSKGTNVGATLAALLGMPGPIVLLAGGQAKGGDFSPLKPVLADKGRALVLFGQDATLIEQAITGAVPVHHAGDLNQAVDQAAQVAQPGDTVLLSPACASFDMFSGYEQRGEKFVMAVRGLPA